MRQGRGGELSLKTTELNDELEVVLVGKTVNTAAKCKDFVIRSRSKVICISQKAEYTVLFMDI